MILAFDFKSSIFNGDASCKFIIIKWNDFLYPNSVFIMINAYSKRPQVCLEVESIMDGSKGAYSDPISSWNSVVYVQAYVHSAPLFCFSFPSLHQNFQLKTIFN